ncbi:MAG TPA: hypothetical protein VLA05_10670 [Coriobacteriia bacterium]|nr:hypothetical protein [Coriobacteriia bacterium]
MTSGYCVPDNLLVEGLLAAPISRVPPGARNSVIDDLLFVLGAESVPRHLPGLVEGAARASRLRIVPTLNKYVGDMSDHHAFRLASQAWATTVLVLKREQLVRNFHHFSLTAWALWMISLVTGFALALPSMI